MDEPLGLVRRDLAVLGILQDDPRVVRMEDKELLFKGERKRAKRVVVTYPWLVPDIRGQVIHKSTVLAADIPFHFRFVYDLDLGSCVRVHGTEVEDKTYLTDLVVNAERFENIPPFKPDLRVLSFDVETSLKEPKIFTICCVV